MTHPGFGHLWMQSDLSDVDIKLTVASHQAPTGEDIAQGQNSNPTILQQFPGHNTILSSSPYFAAQVLRWATKPRPQGSSRTGTAVAIDKAASNNQAQKQLVITLPDASHEPAAMALLSGLYLVKPWPELLADLTPQQQVQAAVLADMWQLTSASQAAVGVLQAAARNADSLSAALKQMLSLEAMPACLLPVFEHSWRALLSKYSSLSAVPQSMRPLLRQILLSKFGDLEAVWAPGNTSLQESLLALPLYAMELLLASDKLKVSSEATVLYTAQIYTDNLASSSRQHAMDRLAPLVRCPHLSQFWLSASVLSDDADKLLLQGLLPQLKQLLLLKTGCRPDACLCAEDFERCVPGAPASWLLPVRDIQPVSSAKVEWEVEVAAIKRAVQESTSQKQRIRQYSQTCCLLARVGWDMQLQGVWDASKQGSTVGVFARAKNLPSNTFCSSTFSLECVDGPSYSKSHKFNDEVWGWPDFFGIRFGPGGFDEGWAAKGLPTSGSITLRLIVKDVGV